MAGNADKNIEISQREEIMETSSLALQKEPEKIGFKIILSVVSCLLACILYLHFVVNKCYVEVDITVSQRSHLKIYWAEGENAFSEDRAAVVIARPGQRTYAFHLTSMGRIDRLRVDTHRYEGEATLTSLRFSQLGWRSITLQGREGLQQLIPNDEVEEYSIDDTGLKLRSNGRDPFFEVNFQPEFVGYPFSKVAVPLFFVVLAVLLLLYFGSFLGAELQIVPLLLFGIWLLILSMAVISQYNVHPDEYIHVAAASYYEAHWLPPEVGDPAIANTYSPYGISRLNYAEVYYLFAGKFKQLFDVFQLPDYLGFRFFNVFLFGLIFSYCLRSYYARLVALPFLVSPQIWYVFSYCSSDCFALFFAFLAGCQLIDPASLLHRYLKGINLSSRVVGTLLLPLLLGILFLLKINYYAFVLLFYIVLASRVAFSEEYYWERRQAVGRIIIITLLGILVLGCRVGVNYMVNGFDRHDKIVSMMEERAHESYKPSTPLEMKHYNLRLRDRGATVSELIHKNRWLEKTFQSSFGVYGYLSISCSQLYYDLVRVTGGMLFVFFFGSLLLRSGLIGGGINLLALSFIGVLLVASFYNSWIFDFQPQGRYLLPVIAILGTLYGLRPRAVNQPFLLVGVGSMFIIGLYSFIFEALLRIPKVPMTSIF